jgi:ribonuclease HII
VASAVVFPSGIRIPGVNDSKQLTARQRERLYEAILDAAADVGVGSADHGEIDRINILNATRLAMERAVAALTVPPDYLLIDALSLDRLTLPQEALIKGDCRCHAIAAASIVAKVTRDRMMVEYHRTFPQYRLYAHKGYGTRDHAARLREYGPSPIHRKTFLRKMGTLPIGKMGTKEPMDSPLRRGDS